MDNADDQQCVSAVLAGNVDAYAALVERYQKPIFNLMYRMTGSRADALDLSQEAFLKAYEQLHRFDEGRRFFPWLYTVALNAARNFLRKSKLQCHASLEDCELDFHSGYPGDQEDALCSRLDSHRLHHALQRLPVSYREAVVLRYQQELSMEDLALALQLSVSGAKMRVHRGLQKLREMLAVDDHEKG